MGLTAFAVGLLVSGSSRAGSQDCDLVERVLLKLNDSNFRIVVPNYSDSDGVEAEVEKIFFDRNMYTRRGGQSWIKDGRTWNPLAFDGKLTFSDCRVANHEVIAGVAVTVVTYERYRPESKMHVRMWINDQIGLPVRAEFSQFEPKSFPKYTTTYYYDNIVPPISE